MAVPTGCPDEARLRALLAGEVDEAGQAELARHLESCPPCRARLDALAGANDLPAAAAEALAEGEPSGDLGDLMDRLKAEGADATQADSLAAHGAVSLSFLSPSADPRHLGRLGEYEVLEVIGRGGMGIVLKARDPKLERLVAVKVLHPELAASGPARARFLREARSAAAVTHEHVVTIHAVDEANDVPFLVMEYVLGVSLEDRIQRTGHLRVEEILRIGMQAAAGLAAAHAQGLVHRDIKPSNIVLENGVERVKITDFGLARVVHEAQLTQTNAVAGTPQYMSPEQARGEPLDHRSDLFSLGCVMYAMCVGRSPFRAETPTGAIHRVREDTPRPIREVNPEVPNWLAAIVDRLLAKKPEDRFQTAGEVTDLLGQYLAHVQQPSRVRLPSGLLRPGPPRRGLFGLRRRTLAIAAVVGCLALVLVALLAMTGTMGLRPRLAPGSPAQGGSSVDAPLASNTPVADSAATAASGKPLPKSDVKKPEAEAARAAARNSKIEELVAEDVLTRYAAANSYALSGQWERAAEEVARAVKANPDALNNFKALAVAQLMAGDTQGYRTTCANALRRFSRLGPVTKAHLVQLCCLSSDSGIEQERMATLLAGAHPSKVSTATLNLALGFYLFRSGRDEEVLTMLGRYGDANAVCWVVLLQAMASQRLGRTEHAKKLLGEAVLKMQQHYSSLDGPPTHYMTERWVQWGVFQILLREAQQMILPKEAPENAACETKVP